MQWWCEAGHAWEVCFGHHKGQEFCFVEVVPVLNDLSGAMDVRLTLEAARLKAETTAKAKWMRVSQERL
jgi:hypothetical protein